jgi:murein DD-endopeptidase MepM/ murein hydrolase activator NlpD
MIYPVNGIFVAQGYSKKHTGVDFGWNSSYGFGKNQPVYAIEDGTIIDIQYQRFSGGYVIHLKLDQRNLVAEYGHLQKGSIRFKVGQHVKMGEQIANMGNTGVAFGNHLHFGLYSGNKINYSVNKWVNPFNYLCAFSNQVVGSGTKQKGYVKYYSKRVTAKDGLWVRKSPSTQGQKCFILDYNQEIESFGVTDNNWNIVDNTLGYYCSNRYLK